MHKSSIIMLSRKILLQIFKNNGAKDISEESIDLFNDIVSKISVEITSIAVKLTRLKGNKTIQKDSIKVGINNFLGKYPENLESKMFPASNIKDIMEKSDGKRVSKNAFDFVNKVITWISEEIALNAVILTHNTKKKLIEKEEIKFGTQKFLEKEIQNKKEDD